MRKVELLKVSFLSLSVLFSLAARADGECTPRPLTAAETQFYRHFATLRTALPKPAAGWRYHDSTQAMLAPGYTGIPAHGCKESNEPYLSERFYYERAPSDNDQAILQRAQDQAPDPAKLAALEQYNQQIGTLTEQVMAAAGKGDMATVDKLNAQIDALSQRTQAALDQLYAPQQAAIAELEHDREASVTMSLNARGAECHGQPRAENRNGALVYHCAFENGYSNSGDILDPASARVVMVFGKAVVQTHSWSRLDSAQRAFNDSSATITVQYDNRRPTTVQNVVVVIDADNPARVEQLAKAVAMDTLAKLVQPVAVTK